MCIADYLIGMSVTPAEKRMATVVGTAKALDANTSRVGVMIAAPASADPIRFWFAATASAVGFKVTATANGPQIFLLKDLGRVVQLPLWVNADDADLPIAIMELLLPESVLHDHAKYGGYK